MVRMLAAALALSVAACSGSTAPPGASRPNPDPMPETITMPPANRPAPTRTEIATFGAGCFWCVEAVLEQLDGVLDVTSGYMGGTQDHPSYEAVCTGLTGHAEVVQVTFDPARIGYGQLLDWFWQLHDPTTRDRQGADVGTQYRSVIFWHDETQRAAAEAAKQARDQALDLGAPIVTEIVAASTFWPAEEYHQDYYRGNKAQGYCRLVISPKLAKLGLRK